MKKSTGNESFKKDPGEKDATLKSRPSFFPLKQTCRLMLPSTELHVDEMPPSESAVCFFKHMNF